ncbi:MAG: PspC domain-containing protein [Methanomassiliicoccales archaeon]
MYCPRCGTGNREGAAYCTSCGAPLPGGSEDRVEGGGRVGDTLDREPGRLNRPTGPPTTFGWVGPLLWSVIAMLVVLVLAGVLAVLGDRSPVLAELGDFLLRNTWLIFGFLLLSSYASFLSKRYQGRFRYFQPVFTAVTLLFALWIAVEILFIVAGQLGSAGLEEAAGVIETFMAVVFLAVLVLGYVTLALSLTREVPVFAGEPVVSPGAPSQRPLYRSGPDRIIGGVCAGLGRHFGVDPWLFRVVFIVALFASFGAAVLVYVLLWFFLPKEPGW